MPACHRRRSTRGPTGRPRPQARRTRRPGPGRAPWSGTGRGRARPDRRRSPGGPGPCSTATCPTPSGVTITTSSPAWTASIASAWWRYGRSMPRDASPDTIRGSSQRGKLGEDRFARRQDRVMDDPAREGRLREQGIQDGAGFGGGVGSHAGCLRRTNGCSKRRESSRPCEPPVTGRLSRPRARAWLTSAV